LRVPGSLSEKVERSGLLVREYETESGDYPLGTPWEEAW
jgi:hypothetical protein